MLTITVEDYRPSPALDEELASLGSTAIHGWPDQAPVDASLARAMLRPAGMTATTLALHRDADGRLLGGAAVRWPATLDAAGRLWGPIVHPDAARQGLGRIRNQSPHGKVPRPADDTYDRRRQQCGAAEEELPSARQNDAKRRNECECQPVVLREDGR